MPGIVNKFRKALPVQHSLLPVGLSIVALHCIQKVLSFGEDLGEVPIPFIIRKTVILFMSPPELRI